MDMERALPRQYPPRPKRAGYLGFVSTIFQITEIFEFAARLSSKGVLGPNTFISIGLHNVKDHQLTSFSINRMLGDNFVNTSDNPIIIDREIPEQDLVSEPDEFALDFVIEIFERFQWNNPPRQVFGEDQKKLRERRL